MKFKNTRLFILIFLFLIFIFCSFTIFMNLKSNMNLKMWTLLLILEFSLQTIWELIKNKIK